jgi:tellurite resistance protein
MREPLAAMWRALEETSALNLSAQQAESFVRTAYAIADAINSRALPREESE